MKKILVVGGSGFVGSRVISHVGEEYCFNLDKNQSPFYNQITDIVDIRDLNNYNISLDVDSVVLLAAEHRDDVFPTSLYYDVNVEGTKNVLSLMDKCSIKNLIFTSSVAIYGLNRDNPNELSTAQPFNHYGLSKWKAEELIFDWYNNDIEGKSVTIIRPTVIFGERNRGNVYNLLKQIASRRFFMVGSGDNQKSMAYVENVASFIKYSLETKQMGYHIYNYSDKPDFTMNQLVTLVESKMDIKQSKIKLPYTFGIIIGYVFDFISSITKSKFTISSVRVKKFCSTTKFDSSKAFESFKPLYSIEEGLNRTLEHEFISKSKDDVLFYTE